ncbi:amidohydrolase [Pseudomarimonas salicorniae]|uniref:Amidohydrolase n=1 Tax=Pseudomarimonas salicorniae TaxID=2933270 RepID=A0ABT0GKW7_9GAMM|nr:amidohydrolase [Lysobacter sp. CAU 1642]MCK7595063.1 amidohydrolase [Lysobacter sp. CAU 1642]
MRALLACAFLLGCGLVQANPVEALAAPLDAKVQAWRRDIHQHPELSNRETRTAALVAAHLRALGLEEVRTGLAHHGVTAVLRGARPGPRIALRADMDALPVTEAVDLPFASRVTTEFRGDTVGVMHACGHDAHTSILMGVAEALAGQRERLAGEILFVFQPAEEGAPKGEEGGASLMLREGLFEGFKPEAMFGLHVWSAMHVGEIGYRSGPFMAASDSFAITVKGRQTHGSRPWGGIDPIAISALLIGSAQQIVSREMNISHLPVVLSFGAIKGGIRNNIIPDQVEMIGTIRSFDEAMREDVFVRLRRVAEHTAAAHGASVELSVPDPNGNPVTVNDPALTRRMLPSLASVVGAEQVHEMGLVMGAEDFSYYAREVPALFFFVGSTPRGVPLAEAPSNHSPHFFLDEGSLRIGLRAMLQLVADYGLLPAGS